MLMLIQEPHNFPIAALHTGCVANKDLNQAYIFATNVDNNQDHDDEEDEENNKDDNFGVGEGGGDCLEESSTVWTEVFVILESVEVKR